MMKIILAILIALLILLVFNPILPVQADSVAQSPENGNQIALPSDNTTDNSTQTSLPPDETTLPPEEYAQPPANPEENWLPPDGGGVIDPPVKVEKFSQGTGGMQMSLPPLPPPQVYQGTIVNAYLVNSYGQVLTSLHRNELCYLIVSFSGPGYFYLWEYYPAGTPSHGHWLCYRWYRPEAGVWKIGPFVAQPGDPPGRYTWKMWYYSGASWSTRSLGFNLIGAYYPPDIPGPLPEPVYKPVINSFSASKANIDAGEIITLTWNTSNATSVTISPDIGSVGASGSTSVTVHQNITYTLLATNRSGNAASSTLNIVVVPRQPPELEISELKIRKGEQVSLSWNAPGAIAVSIDGIGSVGTQGSTQVSPERTTSYTLNAVYADSTTQSARATVEVAEPMYWLLILIILLAAVIAAGIVIFIIRRRRKVRQTTIIEAGTEQALGYDTAVSTEVMPVTTPLMDAPASSLIMPDGSEMLLAGNSRLLGRKDFQDFMPRENATYISRQHINIWYEDGSYHLEDRSSTNGTRLNDMDIKGRGRQVLSEGDVIELASKLRIIFKENKNNKEVL